MSKLPSFQLDTISGIRSELGTGTLPLAAAVLREVGRRGEPRPVVCAAGGISDGKGLAAMLALGCDGVVLGTRLWASEEAMGSVRLKSALVRADGDDVLRTRVFDTIQCVHPRCHRTGLRLTHIAPLVASCASRLDPARTGSPLQLTSPRCIAVMQECVLVDPVACAVRLCRGAAQHHHRRLALPPVGARGGSRLCAECRGRGVQSGVGGGRSRRCSCAGR